MFQKMTFAFVFMIGTSVHASTIDFEDTASGYVRSDLSTRYVPNHNATFTLESGKNHGKSTATTLDIGNASANYYLSSGSASGIGYVKMTLDYASAVNGASGQLWAISSSSKGTEKFKVKALDANGRTIATLTSPTINQNKGDSGTPWTWTFSDSNINSIEMEFIGSKNDVTVALDNLSYTPVAQVANNNAHAAPLPAAAYIGLIGLAGMYTRRRMKNRSA